MQNRIHRSRWETTDRISIAGHESSFNHPLLTNVNPEITGAEQPLYAAGMISRPIRWPQLVSDRDGLRRSARTLALRVPYFDSAQLLRNSTAPNREL